MNIKYLYLLQLITIVFAFICFLCNKPEGTIYFSALTVFMIAWIDIRKAICK